MKTRDLEVSQVLEAFLWPLGRFGRTTCPLHQGTNAQSFWYRGDQWHCFSCGEGGNATSLGRRLGIESLGYKKVEFKLGGTEEMAHMGSRSSGHPVRVRSVAETLRAKGYRERTDQYDRASEACRLGHELVNIGRELFHLDPEIAAETVFAGMSLSEQAETALSHLEDCRRVLSSPGYDQAS